MAENSFFDGNEYFNNGKYQEAIESYNGAIAEEGYSFAKLFNLGMAHKYNGNNGLALLNFERARHINQSKKVLSQINDIRNKLGIQPDTGLAEYSQPKTIKLWLALACISFWKAVFFISLIIMTRKFSKISTVMAGLFAIIFTLALVEINKLTTDGLSAAIVINNGAELLAAPVSKSSKIGQVNEGEYVKASSSKNNFVHIKSKTGVRGWVKTTDIEPIIPKV
ncbi:MAG: SH3 domain-containing protein [Puniceicoccales bacterium]|nr:SH3 domain-containing protein [Puniceicoccales bacterium]